MVYEVLDQGILAHVGFVSAHGPVVIPMGYARRGDSIILHGSAKSRLLTDLAAGAEVCITVTLLDGLVLARSTFHHSMNYRSVVVFAEARRVTDPEERLVAFWSLTEHVLPGRWEEARHPDRSEDKGTLLLALPLDEASAKIRRGPPPAEDEDYALDVWAGVIPLQLVAGQPSPDPALRPGIDVPTDDRDYGRGR